MVSVCRQGRWPLYRRTRQYLRFRSRTLGVGPRRGWGLLPECARASAPASAYCIVSAAVPSVRAHSHSRSVSTLMVLPWKSPHRVRLDLSGRGRENRERHLHSSRCQLLTVGSGTSSSSSSPPMSSPARTLRNGADARGDCSCSPLLWAPSMAERDKILEAIAELPDPSETTPTRWLGQVAPEDQLSPTQSIVRGSETGQTAPPPRWRAPSTKLRMIRETNNFPPHITSLPSPHRATHAQPFKFLTHCEALFPSNRGGLLLQQRNMAAWASPLHFRVHACRTGTKLRAVLQREDLQKWE